MSTADGCPAKTQKAKLLELLEQAGSDPADQEVSVPSTAAVIVDGMATLQALVRPAATYGELAKQVFESITKVVPSWAWVDFVIDTYPDVSIKTSERLRRLKEHGSIQANIISADRKIPLQWKKFLSSGSNKKKLLSFLAEHWSTQPYVADRLSAAGSFGKLFVTDNTTCFLLSCNAGRHLVKASVPELKCSHEEADTRLILHAAHAGNSDHPVVVMKSPDTDVAVLAAAHCSKISGIVLFLTGTKQRRRYINMSAVSTRLGPGICQALPGFHALTGCVSTSAFVGRGKALGWQLLRLNSSIQQDLRLLGEEFSPVNFEELAQSCEAFVCSLYGHAMSKNVNDVRYLMFCSKAGDSSTLPPSQDALVQYILRANYQAAIWCRALEPQLFVPDPHSGHGWTLDNDGHLSIQWMTQPPAPRDLLKMISCNCQTSCTTRRCSCVKENLPCTDVCGCSGCKNMVVNAEKETVDDESGDED